MPVSPSNDELSDVVAFIAAQQAHPDRRIWYVGTDAAGIDAELGGLEPSWETTARVLRDDTGISGAVIAEWDDDLGRTWILGPWVVGDGDPWMAAAASLLDAALSQLPPNVTRYEMCGDIANHRLADLAATRGWTATEPHHVLVADADVVAAWPAAGDGQMASLRAAAPQCDPLRDMRRHRQPPARRSGCDAGLDGDRAAPRPGRGRRRGGRLASSR